MLKFLLISLFFTGPPTFMESVNYILELATSTKSLWIRKSAEELKELLSMIISNPILEGVTVRYDLKKPFAVLVNMSKKEEWWPHRESNSDILADTGF